MAWENQDADGNRQGVTIAELGELGGPGMGGCPAGPADQGAPTPGTASVQRSADGTSMNVRWEAATPVPGAAQVTGYSVEAIAGANTSNGQQTFGARTGAAATGTTITGLAAGETYKVEVRSLAAARMSEAFMTAPIAGIPTGTPNTSLPSLTVTPAVTNNATPVSAPNNSVTATSDGQVWYTTDGSAAIFAGLPSDTAQQLKPGQTIPVTAPSTKIRIVAFNAVGNFVEGFSTYIPGGSTTPAPVTGPAAPTALAVTTPVPQDRATLSWASVPGATSYQVAISEVGAGGALIPLAPQPGPVVNPTGTPITQTVTGLSGSKNYTFTVTAKNAAGVAGQASTAQTFSTPTATDRVTVTKATWRNGDFRVVGTAGPNRTVTVYRVNADGTRGAAISNAQGSSDALGAFDIRPRNAAAPTANPGRIIVGSTGGGFSVVFTVANG
jgi:hypothetical protein